VDGSTVPGHKFGLVQFGTSSSKKKPSSAGLVPASSVVDYLQNSMVYTGGMTHTGGAIEDCRDNLNAAGGSNKVMVLVTDGTPTRPSSGPQAEATEQANIAKDTYGITILPVLVKTTSTDSSFLKSLGSLDELIHVDLFDQLNTLVGELTSLMFCGEDALAFARPSTGCAGDKQVLKKWEAGDFNDGDDQWTDGGSRAGVTGRSEIAGYVWVKKDGSESRWTSPEVQAPGAGSITVLYKTCMHQTEHDDDWYIQIDYDDAGTWENINTHIHQTFSDNSEFDSDLDDNKCRDIAQTFDVDSATSMKFRLQGDMSSTGDFAYLGHFAVEFCPASGEGPLTVAPTVAPTTNPTTNPTTSPQASSSSVNCDTASFADYDEVASYDFTTGTHGWSDGGNKAWSTNYGLSMKKDGSQAKWTSPPITLHPGKAKLQYRYCFNANYDSDDEWHLKYSVVGSSGTGTLQAHESVDWNSNADCRNAEVTVNVHSSIGIHLIFENEASKSNEQVTISYFNVASCETP